MSAKHVKASFLHHQLVNTCAMAIVAEQPLKKRKQRERVKYLDVEVPVDKKERRAALQQLYERERRFLLIQDKFSFFGNYIPLGSACCVSDCCSHLSLDISRNQKKNRHKEKFDQARCCNPVRSWRLSNESHEGSATGERELQVPSSGGI